MIIKTRIVNEFIRYDIDDNATVKDLKKLLEKDFKDFRINRLEIETKNLNDADLLKNCCVDKETIIDVFLTERKFQIHITDVKRKKISLNVCDEDRVIDIKERCEVEFDLRKEEQTMTHKQDTLDDDKILFDYRIYSGSCLTVIPKVLATKKMINIRDDDKLVCAVMAEDKDTVSSIKRLANQSGKTLYYGDTALCDSDRVDDIGNVNAHFSLHIRNDMKREEIQLIVKIVTNQTRNISIKINKNHSCLALKQEIQKISGFVMDDEWLLTFNGYALENSKSLAEYHLSDNSIVLVTPKLRGGSS